MKRTIISILTLSIVSITMLSNYNNNAVSALTYSDNVGVNFTFSPSLTISLSSSDIVINDLAPGSSSDSNVITINVLSNNLNGYELKSSVGNTTYNDRNLTYAGGSAIFSSIDYGSSLESLTTDNTWGYSYSLDNSSWSNYSGLPKYDDTTNVATLNSNSGPSSSTGDNTYFRIAAKASSTQIAGEYNNVINFYLVGNTNPVSFYDAFSSAAETDPSITMLNGYYKMQDMTPAICSAVDVYDDDSHIQLIDTRDNEVYWIGKLKDDRCWLLDNLRLGSNDYEIPLTPEDTNIAEDWTLPKGFTGDDFRSYTEPHINTTYKNDTNVTSYGTASGKVGVYYNYCAVSGGTYCYDSDSDINNPRRDVCPANWKVPTGGENGEYQTLRNQYSSVIATDSVSFQYSLSTQLSGSFYDVRQYNLNLFGNFWSSTYSNTQSMYILDIDPNGVRAAQSGKPRNNGVPVRCIANNQ